VPPTSPRLDTLPPYVLAAIPQKKRDLIARGMDVIDLGAGDADLAPPPRAIAAMREAVGNPA
jgi:LL-diaminopimelate aminotransferase